MAPLPPRPVPPNSDFSTQVACCPIYGDVGSKAVCPICSCELYEKKDELGALTQQGLRVEANLYHGSCITLMLAHNGAVMKTQVDSDMAVDKDALPFEISWGLSPVSRRPIDGFLKMPPLTDATSLLEFIDWKQRGKITLEDLVIFVSALLPLDENCVGDFVKSTFKVEDDGTVSDSELQKHVFPYLQTKCFGMRPTQSINSSQAQSAFGKASPALKMLTDSAHLFSLRAVSKSAGGVASCLLIYELCLLLRLSSQLHFSEAGREVTKVVKAIASIASQSTVVASSICAYGFVLDDVELNTMLAKLLPTLSPRDPWRIFADLNVKLKDRAVQTRVVVLNALTDCSCADNRHTMRTLVDSVSDSDSRICTVAIDSIAQIAEKGDQLAIAPLVSHLSSRNPKVKHCAEAALAIVAASDAQTIDRFLKDLSATEVQVRLRAIRALGLIVVRGEARIVAALLAFVELEVDKKENPDAYECKIAAMLALGRLAKKGEKAVMTKLASSLRDGMRNIDCRTAEVALRSLARLTEKKNRWAVQALSSVFDPGVTCPFARALKILVLEKLGEIGQGGDALIFSIASAQFNEGDLEVRTQAIRTAGKVWLPGQDRGVDELGALTKGFGDALVRREAEHALELIAEARRNMPVSHRRSRCQCILM